MSVDHTGEGRQSEVVLTAAAGYSPLRSVRGWDAFTRAGTMGVVHGSGFRLICLGLLGRHQGSSDECEESRDVLLLFTAKYNELVPK